MKPAALSTVLGSVAEPPRLMAVPSGLVAGAPLIDGVGATLVTVIVLVVVRAAAVLVGGGQADDVGAVVVRA